MGLTGSHGVKLQSWSRAFEHRWKGQKEDSGIVGKEEVGDDGAVTSGEGKYSTVGVVGMAEMEVPELGA